MEPRPYALELRFERIGKSFAQRKPTIWSCHACDSFRVLRGGGEPPARVPHDKTFPRKVLSPLLRFFEKKYFAVCGRQRGALPHTPPPLKRRAKLFSLHILRFERICSDFAQRKLTIYPAFHAVRFERIGKSFAQRKPTIWSRHACDSLRVLRGDLFTPRVRFTPRITRRARDTRPYKIVNQIYIIKNCGVCITHTLQRRTTIFHKKARTGKILSV